jgi:hypothetical protein
MVRVPDERLPVQDGFHWSRLEGEHPSGAILDLEEEGDLDRYMIGWPQVRRMN